MNGYEFIAALIKSLSWPIVVLAVFLIFRIQLKKLIENLRIFKASKEGLEFSMAEVSKAILDDELWSTQDRFNAEKKKRQIIARWTSNLGVSMLYANGIIISRTKVVLAAGSKFQKVLLPSSMVHECSSVQFVGDIDARVTQMDHSFISFEYAPSDSERTIEMVATGL